MKLSKKLKWLSLIWFVIIIIVAVFAISGVSMMKLTIDVLQHLGQPVYLGLLSNVGILAWCMAGCICLFSSHMVRTENQPDAGSGFLKWLGILSFILLGDDLFMLHEVIMPKYFHLPEVSIYVVYLVYVAVFLFKYWRFILNRTDYGFLVAAFCLMGASLAIDIDVLPGGIDVEDGFKLFGIVTFAFYCTISAGQLIVAAKR